MSTVDIRGVFYNQNPDILPLLNRILNYMAQVYSGKRAFPAPYFKMPERVPPPGFYTNPLMFEISGYHYDRICARNGELCAKIRENRLHPRNSGRFADWGF
jgi:hypothetical protein